MFFPLSPRSSPYSAARNSSSDLLVNGLVKRPALQRSEPGSRVRGQGFVAHHFAPRLWNRGSQGANIITSPLITNVWSVILPAAFGKLKAISFDLRNTVPYQMIENCSPIYDIHRWRINCSLFHATRSRIAAMWYSWTRTFWKYNKILEALNPRPKTVFELYLWVFLGNRDRMMTRFRFRFRFAVRSRNPCTLCVSRSGRMPTVGPVDGARAVVRAPQSPSRSRGDRRRLGGAFLWRKRT